MYIGPLQNENKNANFGWNDESRNTWFNVTYEAPAPIENPTIRSAICFFAKTRGESPLTFIIAASAIQLSFVQKQKK